MKIGIDKIGFYTTPLYLDLTELAQARGVDPNKYLIGIGQEKQAVIPPTQDIVTMGANAADRILTDEDRKQISTIIVATESGIDNSKAAAIYVKELLQLDPFVRAVEVKEACYSGTAALQFARGLISLNPDEKVLIIAADIYGLETSGEVTQGGGAIAMMISAEPRVLAIDGPSVPYSEDVMDFWRPLYASEALVDGKYSTSVYIDFFQKTWERYQTLTDQTLSDMAAMIFHLPFTKMGKKALDAILGDQNDPHSVLMRTQLAASQALSRQVGNLYTGSLYLALLSLLTRSHNLQSGDRIGLFSYGSGAQGEFFTGILQADFKEMVRQADVEKLIMARKQVSVPEYERLFRAQIGYNSKNVFLDLSQDHEKYVLQGQQDQKRVYLIQ